MPRSRSRSPRKGKAAKAQVDRSLRKGKAAKTQAARPEQRRGSEAPHVITASPPRAPRRRRRSPPTAPGSRSPSRGSRGDGSKASDDEDGESAECETVVTSSRELQSLIDAAVEERVGERVAEEVAKVFDASASSRSQTFPPWPPGPPPPAWAGTPSKAAPEKLVAGRDPRPPEGESQRRQCQLLETVCESISDTNVQLKSIAADMCESLRRESTRAPQILKQLNRIADSTEKVADQTCDLCNFAEKANEMAEAAAIRQQWGSSGGGGGGAWKSG